MPCYIAFLCAIGSVVPHSTNFQGAQFCRLTFSKIHKNYVCGWRGVASFDILPDLNCDSIIQDFQWANRVENVQMFQALVQCWGYGEQLCVQGHLGSCSLYLPRHRGRWQVPYKCSLGSWDFFIRTCLAKIAKESHTTLKQCRTLYTYIVLHIRTPNFLWGVNFHSWLVLLETLALYGTYAPKHLYLSPLC